jgi:hypothetical protein
MPSPSIGRDIEAGRSDEVNVESGRRTSLSDSRNVGNLVDVEASAAELKKGGGASLSSNGGGAAPEDMLGPASPSE